MKCKKCKNKSIYSNNGLLLCKNHFLSYFENKVEKTIKKYSLYEKNDKICVAVSGGKDSLSLLYTTMKYCRKKGIELFALTIDEGIKGYRDFTLKDLKYFCRQHKIKLHTVSFNEKIGAALDDIKDKAFEKLHKKPCTICGILRRTYLNRTARDLGATKLATGHNLDDEAQSFIMNVFLGNMKSNAALGPITGLSKDDKFVQRVKPLYFISEKETRLYAFLKGFKIKFAECPNINLSFRREIQDRINEIEEKFPGTKHRIVNSFMEILPLLKKHYSAKPFSYCKRCGDACSGIICNACALEEELRII